MTKLQDGEYEIMREEGDFEVQRSEQKDTQQTEVKKMTNVVFKCISNK